MNSPKPMSRKELLAQEECCGSICTNCPYLPKYIKGSKEIDIIS
ncbi:hypothetical protein J4414_00045 [Candidatus Woesearchaeota archaeon]|nr:hypothetical protein [Candidatus Woesearchaeota archaeon]